MTYYDRWIKPMEGLNAGTVHAGRPPGNEPELMPWDASLNQGVGCAVGRHAAFCSMIESADSGYDVDCAVGRHVAFCSMMLESTDAGYDKRFTRYTPKTQGSS